MSKGGTLRDLVGPGPCGLFNKGRGRLVWRTQYGSKNGFGLVLFVWLLFFGLNCFVV